MLRARPRLGPGWVRDGAPAVSLLLTAESAFDCGVQHNVLSPPTPLSCCQVLSWVPAPAAGHMHWADGWGDARRGPRDARRDGGRAGRDPWRGARGRRPGQIGGEVRGWAGTVTAKTKVGGSAEKRNLSGRESAEP